jgi:hypothetical protein
MALLPREALAAFQAPSLALGQVLTSRVKVCPSFVLHSALRRVLLAFDVLAMGETEFEESRSR